MAGIDGDESLPAVSGARESVLDGVVQIEPELVTEIPDAARWCERLELARRRVDVGDVQLYVEEEGDGVPLVLIHGGPGGTHHYFHPSFARATEYARVIYYDQRGCGLSDFEPGKDGYSVGQAVDDLDALRRSLNVDRWVVLGHSYGGFLAQLYTVHYPESVAGLILVGASPGMPVQMGPSRQGEFLSAQERARIDEIGRQVRQYARQDGLSPRQALQLLVYNNFLNGDWKRQHFYKPTPERMAQIALYEWDHDDGFNATMSSSESGVDLTGAFDDNPIPTLILEGKWDLTWNETKPAILAQNHPHARLAIFEQAGHDVFDEEPDRFFGLLEEFLRTLPDVSAEAISAYASALDSWQRDRQASPEFAVQSAGWGLKSSRRLAGEYDSSWLERFHQARSLLRIGFALYDVANYEEALIAFGRMERAAIEQQSRSYEAMALIWQGQMLDLLGKRDEAIRRYRRAAAMNLNSSSQHSQYGMDYELSPYARERTKSPFQRIGNRDPG
ncbi:MAG: alpha/beta fold hydrolase [Acidobacteriota bacterium]